MEHRSLIFVGAVVAGAVLAAGPLVAARYPQGWGTLPTSCMRCAGGPDPSASAAHEDHGLGQHWRWSGRLAQSWTPLTGQVPRPSTGETVDDGSAQAPGSPSGAGPPAAPDGSEIEITFWNSVKDSNDPALLEAYLDRFPKGTFEAIARSKLDSLKGGGAGRPDTTKGARPTAALEAGELPQGRTLTLKTRLGAFPGSGGTQNTIDGQARGWLGVRIQSVDATLDKALGRPTSGGALVIEVTAGGPAVAASHLIGDIILSVDGRNVRSAPELARIIASYRAGDEAAIESWRLGQGATDFGRYLRHQADGGNVEAMHAFAMLSASGTVVPKDESLAARFAREAAEANLIEAAAFWGQLLLIGRGTAADPGEAAKWFRRAADAGHVDSMNDLATMYEQGRGVAKDDAEALRWSRQAADKGQVAAMNRLGRYHHFGIAVAKDAAEAARWYRKAVDAGDASSMNNLGVLYELGEGVPKDVTEAVKLYKRAAELGHTMAMSNLAANYDRGQGIAMDAAEAARLMYAALEKGDQDVVNRINESGAKWSVDFRKNLQQRLKSAGLYDGTIDGKFGPGMKRAIESLARQPRAAVQ